MESFTYNLIEKWTPASQTYKAFKKKKLKMKTVRPRGFSSQPDKTGIKQTQNCMAKCYINSGVDGLYKTAVYQDKNEDCGFTSIPANGYSILDCNS